MQPSLPPPVPPSPLYPFQLICTADTHTCSQARKPHWHTPFARLAHPPCKQSKQGPSAVSPGEALQTPKHNFFFPPPRPSNSGPSRSVCTQVRHNGLASPTGAQMVGFCTGNHFCGSRNTMFPFCTWSHTQVWTSTSQRSCLRNLSSYRTCMI